MNLNCSITWLLLQKKLTADAIEDNLAHLEEFCGLIDLIRDDNTQCFEQLLPRVLEQSQDLELLYAEIDKVERTISVVKHTVNKMEEEVSNGEKQLMSSNTVKKFFTTLFHNTNKKVYSSRRLKYVEPKIYDTTDLFGPSVEVGTEVEVASTSDNHCDANTDADGALPTTK